MPQAKPEALPLYRVTDRGQITRPTQSFQPGELIEVGLQDLWLIDQGYVEAVHESDSVKPIVLKDGE